MTITTRLARVAPPVLFLFCVGVFTQTGYLLIVSLFFGGDGGTVDALLLLTPKVKIVSLASVAVFSGLDPDRLSIGLLWHGCPDGLAFSISFGYRVLPILMEEFQNILLSFRLRGKAPDHRTLGGKIKYPVYQIKIIIQSFYPLMLNMAKRSRTTVEALEIKGHRYSTSNPAVKRIKLRALRLKKAGFPICGNLSGLGRLMRRNCTDRLFIGEQQSMRIDFHTHGKLAKHLPFSREYTQWLFGEVSQLDFIDLNGKDAAFGRDTIETKTRALAYRLGLPVVAGSDMHQASQYGCIYNISEDDLTTIDALKRSITQGRYTIAYSEFAAAQVRTAGTIKRALKEIHALGGDYASILTAE